MTGADEETETEAARKLFAGCCDFRLGIADLGQLPSAAIPEVAFAGRSNVGKSTLLNALTGRKALARVSHTPGRTQQLNFFELGGGACFLVDMPGYGYAKVSKTQRSAWDALIFTYLQGRPTLRAVFLLIDSRHGIKDSDRHLFKLLDKAGVSYRIVLTKSDKARPGALAGVVNTTENELAKHPAAYPQVLAVSAHKGTGIPELQKAVRACTHNWA